MTTDMPPKDWQDDAWLEKPLDRDHILALADRLGRRGPISENEIRSGKPRTIAAPDTDCHEAAYWLRYFMGEKR
jgi:hypothetical protein